MSEQRVEKDKVVTLTYTIRDESGLCEKSDYPVSYLHGSPDSPMFPKIEKALEGLKVGDEVEVTLPRPFPTASQTCRPAIARWAPRPSFTMISANP